MTTSGPWGLQTRGTRLTEAPPAAVLVVDDDPAKRLALRSVLDPLGLTIVEADSGLGALRRVMERDFAVILLDVRMPDIDGFETAALIRRRRESEMTPIIFITAFASDEIGSLAKYVEGAVDFMFAPVQPDELRAKVSVFVSLFLQAERYAAEARIVQASADQLKLLTDSAPIGIFRTDASNRYVYTNPRWSEITGISAEIAFGQDWEAMLSSREPRGSRLESRGIAFNGGDRYRLWLSRSVERVVLLTSESVLDDAGEVTGWVGTLADITSEWGAEKERSRFQSLVQNSRDVIVVLNGDGRCTYVSPAVEEVTGFLPEELIGTLGIDSVHPDDAQMVRDHFAEITTSPDSTKTVEARRRTKSGGWIWVEIRAANRLNDPALEGMVLNYHDISERRDWTDRLAQSEELLANGQALSHLGSFTWDMRSNVVTWSDENYRLLGFEPGSVEPSLETLVSRLHPDDRVGFLQMTSASAEGGTPFERDMRVVLPEGTVRWLHVRGEYSTEDGVPVRLTGMNEDITARREAELERLVLLEDQKALADQLRMLLDSTGEGIYGVDVHGVCTFMNAAGASLLGGTSADFVGKVMHELMHHTHPDGSHYPASECPIVQGIRRGERTSTRSELVWRLDGSSFPADYSSYPIGGEGSDQGAVIAFQDVSLRLGMEAEIRQSERLFRGAFDASQMGISLIAADGLTYVDVNQALCEMLGYAKHELLELNWQFLTHPDDLERNLRRFAMVTDGRSDGENLTKRYVRKDGESIEVEVTDSVVRGPDGVPIYYVTHVNDITERRKALLENEKLQGELVQAQKMEAVGQLAGGVAHDFNNILSVILNYAHFAAEGLEPDDERLADIQEISKAGDKAANLVHQLLAFSRKEVIEARVIDLNEVVMGVYQILNRSLGEDIDLDFKAGDDLPQVLADPGRVEQVLLNLAVNARDAMLDGGVLKIATQSLQVAEGELSQCPAGGYCVITVTDSGSGMDEETLERVFEPFFTTKPRGEGTGMGLSSAYGIVDQAGGCLSVESTLGVGTVFTVHLPAVSAGISQEDIEEETAAIGGSEMILLVEDEDAVRELVLRILRNQGYEVVPYSSGAEALEYCRSHLETIDLLLTDVVMPRMSGRELSEQASSICAGLKTLFMSGYTDALIAQRGVLASNEHLIYKPFKPEQLLTTVRSLLDVEVTV